MTCHARNHWVLLLVPVFLLPANSAISDEGNYTLRGESGSWTQHGWNVSRQYADIVNYGERPDKTALNGLTIDWNETALDALGNQLTIRGRVMMTEGDEDRKRTMPIDWFQGVTVYMGMRPDAKPDWSMGMDESNTLNATTVTDPTGAFETRIDMRQSMHDRTREQSFQFAVALAIHGGNDQRNQSVSWNSSTPAIPSSVQMLMVAAAPELSSELVLINRASGWPFTNPNGVDLIRAVNALQPLGKERSLRVLEQYVDLTQHPDYWRDQEIVFWIIRLLFEPVQVGDRIPVPMIAVHLDDDQREDSVKWPLNPLTVEKDIPFMVGRQIGMGGVPEQPSSHIRWVRLHGNIRNEPLVPKVDPLAAAEAILQSPRFAALSKHSREEGIRSIRSQALSMVQDLGLVQAEDRLWITDAEWRRILKAVADADVRWDANSERFATVVSALGATQR